MADSSPPPAQPFKSRLCVLDTETTGFASWSRVVELAGVILDLDGSEVAAWSALVIPDILDERANEAFKVNKLSAEMIRAGGCDTYGAAQSFLGFLQSNRCQWVTSYNVKFDEPMVARMGLKLKWAPCVMERAKAALRGAGGPYPGGSLARVAEHYGVTSDGPAHRALADARVAAGILITIRRRELGGAP